MKRKQKTGLVLDGVTGEPLTFDGGTNFSQWTTGDKCELVPVSRFVKSVEWAYQTSPNADRLGFKRGCWTVEVGERGKPLTALRGFVERADALAIARLIPCAWSYSFKAIHPEETL